MGGRFSLRTMLIAVLGICLLLSLCRLVGWDQATAIAGLLYILAPTIAFGVVLALGLERSEKRQQIIVLVIATLTAFFAVLAAARLEFEEAMVLAILVGCWVPQWIFAGIVSHFWRARRG